MTGAYSLSGADFPGFELHGLDSSLLDSNPSSFHFPMILDFELSKECLVEWFAEVGVVIVVSVHLVCCVVVIASLDA